MSDLTPETLRRLFDHVAGNWARRRLIEHVKTWEADRKRLEKLERAVLFHAFNGRTDWPYPDEYEMALAESLAVAEEIEDQPR